MTRYYATPEGNIPFTAEEEAELDAAAAAAAEEAKRKMAAELGLEVDNPEVGETVIYASSPAELAQKMRLLINPRYRGDVKIERILPSAAGKFFMDKRMKHLRNRK